MTPAGSPAAAHRPQDSEDAGKSWEELEEEARRQGRDARRDLRRRGKALCDQTQAHPPAPPPPL